MDLSDIEQNSAQISTGNTDRTTRSSARIRAAKDKDAVEDNSGASTSRPTKRSRDTKGKGKERDGEERSSKRQRRATIATPTALTINEPVRDPKGKKRAIDPTSSDDEATRPLKRSRSSYALRTRPTTASTSTTITPPETAMPKTTTKTRVTGKGKAAAAKAKAMAAPGPSHLPDDDAEMGASDYEVEEDVVEEEEAHRVDEKAEENAEDEHDDEDEAEEDDDDEGNNADDGDAPAAPTDETPAPATSAPLSMFGDFTQFGSYMLNISSRLRTMLTNIKPSADPTTRLITLQELSELLSISTEDTLAGSFQIDAYAKELVRILGGTGNTESDGEGGEDQQDEDAALAAALAISTGGFGGDENLEAQVLACRCLANMMEALPGTAHTVVYHGAIPVLCSKLIEISYIDLAEQTLSTLEKISEEFPQAIVREGGLSALLNYLDFFSIAVQRTALQAAANCCRNVSAEYFPMVRAAWPTIRNCLSYSDQRLVEYASLCVVRVIDSYHRHSPTNLEALVDSDLVRAVNGLLSPAGGSPLIASNTFTLFLKSLSLAARASAKIAVVLLEEGMIDTLHQIFTGILPPASDAHVGDEQGAAEGGQGLGGGLADMAVMETLAHRPKDQVEAALDVISELLPPISKDGVFDHKAYSEKALARMIKAKSKADRAAAKQATAGPSSTSTVRAPPAIESGRSTPATISEDSASATAEAVAAESLIGEGEDATAAVETVKEPIVDRKELLRSKPAIVRHFMHLMVPILIDVYAASVASDVRGKTVNSLLKAVNFLEGADLEPILKYVPAASFAGSILSSHDNPSLVLGALQLVEMLLNKLPKQYKASFRREGVLHEIEALSERTLTTAAKKEDEKEKDKDSEKDKDGTQSDATSTGEPSAASSGSASPQKKAASIPLDPEDMITLRAKVIRFKYLSGAEEDGEDVFATLRQLVARLLAIDATQDTVVVALNELAEHFASSATTVSSFELLQSGVVDGLLEFATVERAGLSIETKQELLFNAFGSKKGKEVSTPFSLLVKKLQESLTRMESFDVVTVAQGLNDSKRSSPSLLARQLRLRLVAAESSDIPRNFQNIVVSIHAIATFQALNDYLRPRVAGLLSGESRLSGMLAALRAAQDATVSAPPPSTSNADLALAASTSASAPPPPQPRRSQRLSAKASSSSLAGAVAADNAVDEDDAEQSGREGNDDGTAGLLVAQDAPASGGQTSPQSTAVGEPDPSEVLMHDDEDGDYVDDDIDAEMYDEEHEHVEAEKTVTLAIASDGGKVEAQTPDGTRIATPNPPKDEVGTIGTSSAKPSYAAALKSKPTDWHLEFSMDDQPLPLDLTIYGAIHQHEMRKGNGSVPSSTIWQGVYTITFKKVPGPAPATEARSDGSESRSRSPNLMMTSLPPDAAHTKILRLLRVLHKLNVREREHASHSAESRSLADPAFVNNKLTAKLTRQLEEPMIVASSCLPDWALDLPQQYPFLFPFATRYNFLQSTSFGYARLIMKWQTQHSRGQDNSRRDDSFGFLGRLMRQKVRISRKHILESAVKVFELYGSSSSILEVEYFEEVGTGLGPTLEFYSLVSKEFARRDLKIWREADSTIPGSYVHHPLGLYPAPLSPADMVTEGGQKRSQILRVIGQFVAKAMLDSRIIDVSLNKLFLRIIMGDVVPLTIANLKLVDPALAHSLTRLEGYASQALVEEDPHCIVETAEPRVNIEDLSLDFTIPGYDVELRPGGKEMSVTATNVHEYIHEVLDAIIGKGAQMQAKAFREGFSKVFPVGDLQAFSADELVMLFGNADEDWSSETLNESIKADHGFHMESRAIRDLVDVISEYDQPTRRGFLQFITGSPKLPIGGFRGLNPPLTVVRKPHEAPLVADDYLPSVMTCVNYLKLPEYSSRDVMREKLRTALQEGIGSFHLS